MTKSNNFFFILVLRQAPQAPVICIHVHMYVYIVHVPHVNLYIYVAPYVYIHVNLNVLICFDCMYVHMYVIYILVYKLYINYITGWIVKGAQNCIYE